MKEQLILLRNRENYENGTYDPMDPKQYEATDGFAGIKRALKMTPDEIVEELKISGLRGRGGAGFPTWRKFQFCMGDADVKYVVCNADEGEPGTNKDRILLTVDPCAVFEGMMIAGKAIGAHYGYIYLRAEYRYMKEELEELMQRCRDNNYLGKGIFGSDFDFDLELCMGNGAYVCGEETALFESIEGKRGEPRFRPPYPATNGLFGKPTLLNNVETLSNLAPIFREGAEWYNKIGTEGSTGTKLFTVSGNILRKGVYELPMGANLKELIYDLCGGIADGHKLLGVQTGGASGAIVNADQIDVALDIDHVSESGGRLACGTIMVYSDKNCIVDILRNDMDFFREESCGQCTPCREGSYELYRLITKIARGEGSVADMETILELCEVMKNTALCGLGVSSTVPVVSTLNNFRKDFLDHIDGEFCPVCSENGGDE